MWAIFKKQRVACDSFVLKRNGMCSIYFSAKCASSRSIFYVPGNFSFPGTKKESPGEAILKGEGMKKI